MFFGVFDYNKYDVILLYRFIRNLCIILKLLKDWGKELKIMDLKIGDDIKCIRFFRNKYYVYVEFVKIFDSEFIDFWNEGKFFIYCI